MLMIKAMFIILVLAKISSRLLPSLHLAPNFPELYHKQHLE